MRQTSPLIQIDVALGRSEVWILFRLPQEFVELAVQHGSTRFLGFNLLAKHFIAAPGLALELGDGGGEIFDGRWFFRNFVRNYGARFRIDFQRRLAART